MNGVNMEPVPHSGAIVACRIAYTGPLTSSAIRPTHDQDTSAHRSGRRFGARCSGATTDHDAGAEPAASEIARLRRREPGNPRAAGSVAGRRRRQHHHAGSESSGRPCESKYAASWAFEARHSSQSRSTTNLLPGWPRERGSCMTRISVPAQYGQKIRQRSISPASVLLSSYVKLWSTDLDLCRRPARAPRLVAALPIPPPRLCNRSDDQPLEHRRVDVG